MANGYQLNPDLFGMGYRGPTQPPDPSLGLGQSEPVLAPPEAFSGPMDGGEQAPNDVGTAPVPAGPTGPPMQGMPGTQTTQFQGEASPTTRYVPIGPRQGEMPAWYNNYETERKAFLAQRKAENEAWSMAQQMAANKELEASYTKAMQLEGSLGFAAAVQAGVPVQQALAQYAPKMYWNNPSASSHALTGLASNAARQSRMNEPLWSKTVDGTRFAGGGGMTTRALPDVGSGEPGTGPIEARPITLGGEQIGSAVGGKRGGLHVQYNKEEDQLSKTAQINVLHRRVTSLDKRIDDASKSERIPLESQRAKLEAQIDELMNQKPRSKPKVGDVVNGFRYKGGPANSQKSWEEE